MCTIQGTQTRSRTAAGYTLMELAMGMAITAILGGVSMPTVLHTIQQYRADAAPRQVMGDLRFAQAQAIARGMQARVVIFDAAGQAPGAGAGGTAYTDPTKANKYRVEVRPSGGAWPALADTRGTNGNVLSEWVDLAGEYRQSVTQATAVGFTSRGSLQNSAVALNIAVQTTPGGTSRTVRTHPSGQVEVLDGLGNAIL